MDTERQFRRVFVAFLAPFVAMRIIARLIWGRRPSLPRPGQRAETGGFRQRWVELTAHERRLSVVARAVLAFLLVILVPLYFVAPQWVQRYTVPLPKWLRWIGAGLGFTSLPLLAWTHLSLGRVWSTNLELQEQHILVTSGPYRWIRHPMYAAVSAFFAGSALISANGVIIAPAGAALWIMAARMGDEESMMITRFGEDYRAYMERTGRILPRVRR